MITTTAFRTLAENERRAKGAPDLPLILIDHPLGGEKAAGVAARASQAADALALATGVPREGVPAPARGEPVRA